MANSPSQMHLIRCAQAGDSEAFSSLYEAHRRKVYSICLRITGEPSEAEDCTQEAFLQCFVRLSTFRGDSALSTWLHRLTVNVVLMRLRAHRHRPMSVELGPSSEHAGETSLLNLLPVEDQQLTGTIDRIAIGRALGKLPTGYRTVFLLHDVEGLGHIQVAASSSSLAVASFLAPLNGEPAPQAHQRQHSQLPIAQTQAGPAT